MPDDTTILSLPLILPAQAQKHVTHNEALVALDLIVQLTVLDRVQAAPPSLPVPGDRHIVAAGATGAWAGQAGRIALFAETGWQFTQALPGWRAHVLAEGQTAVFDGLSWITPSEAPLSVPQLGVAAMADAVNRLTVAAPATLLNHAGSGHQLKLNKATAGDTASLLFQTGFGGRAEMGTTGGDDFSVKVSADGNVWFTALEADAATGEVTFPAPLHLGGQPADPSSPADGTLWLNTTTGEVKLRAGGATVPLGSGGSGGVADGDKGDITVSGGGGVWTVDPGAITLAKLASVPTDSFLGRDTAGTGVPETLTPAQARGILNVGDGATANATDAALRDRATHTGTQNATTITGLAAVATSGSASDLSAGTLPAARFNDAAHGNRAGGALHPDATTGVSGFMSGADKAKLNGIATGATANSADATLLARATHTGTQPSTTISDFAEAVDDRVATLLVAGANVSLSYDDAGNALTIAATGGGGSANLSYDAATRIVASDTGTDATLPLVTSADAGLAPASGGGTANFLRADGAWAAPGGGGGSPGGATGEVQWNNGGAFGGAADVEIEGGQLRLPVIATPTAPAAGGVKLFGQSVAGRILPTIIGPSGLSSSLQAYLARNKIAYAVPIGNSTSINLLGIVVNTTGTATAKNWASTNRYTKMRGIEYLVTTAAATAVVGFRGGAAQFSIGSNAAGDGGFHFVCRWGPATGVATATTRAFVGMHTSTGAPTDVETSSRANIVGMGWDAADANIQFMHNDGSGTATKIDLGAGFPVPTVDRAHAYEIAMFSPSGTTQSVTYEVTNLVTGVVATGTVTTDLPGTTTGLNPYSSLSVGGTSSVIGICLFSLYVETDY